MKLAKNLERLGTETAFTVLAEAKKLESTGKPIIYFNIISFLINLFFLYLFFIST